MSDQDPLLPGVVNVRDVGGHPTTDGTTTRSGLVLRSGQLGAIGVEDTIDVAALGIDVVFDLRTGSEVAARPDRVPDHVDVVHLDVLADATESIMAHLAEIFADPTSAARVFGDGVVHRHYLRTYQHLVTLDSARRSYRELYLGLASADGPALFHCTAGKDRTGWAAAALQALLGVDRPTITAEYLLSNAPVLESFAPYLEQFAEMGGDPSVIEPAFMVEPEYLDAAFATVDEEFGSIERYFADGLGVDEAEQDRLRERLLDLSAR